MKYIEMKLSLPAVAPLVDFMQAARESLRDTLAAPLRIEDIDPEFREVWTSELVDMQNSELEEFFALFSKEFYSDGIVRIGEDRADVIVRGCAALRLQLRRSLLSKIADETLESGDLQLDALAEPEHSGFLCYVFLATIQELVIQRLEGGLASDGEV